MKSEYKDQLEDVEGLKESELDDHLKEMKLYGRLKDTKLDDVQRSVLRGFVQRLDHNTPEPSKLDKIKVAQAYYDGMCTWAFLITDQY